MPRWIAAVAALALLAVAAGCGEDEATGLPAAVTPGITPLGTPGASLTPAAFPPGQEVAQFRGETIAFSYPADWQLWSKSYEAQRETVVLASVPPQEEGEALPEGAIWMQFTGMPAEAPESVPGEIVQTMDVGGVRFSLRKGEETTWLWTGGFKIGGIDFRYSAKVLVNTAEAEPDLLRPVLESWVIGSTNHHPARRCISPGACP